MTKYYMKGTPFWKLERMMMRAPGDVHGEEDEQNRRKMFECGDCDFYIQNQPCALVDCKRLPARLMGGDITLDRLARTLYKSNPNVLKRLDTLEQTRRPAVFLNEEHRNRWKHWRDRFYKMPNKGKAAMYLLTAYSSIWETAVWCMSEDGFDYRTMCVGSLSTNESAVYQAARAIEVNSRNILAGDLASEELVSDDAFMLITGALLLAIFGEQILKGEWW